MNSYEKMREALLEARRFVFQSSKMADRDLLILDDQGPRILQPQDTLAKMDAALALPPRQCDMGTAEEQDRRFKKFCNKHCRGSNVRYPCLTCPLPVDKCQLAWAQMPYKKGIRDA